MSKFKYFLFQRVAGGGIAAWKLEPNGLQRAIRTRDSLVCETELNLRKQSLAYVSMHEWMLEHQAGWHRRKIPVPAILINCPGLFLFPGNGRKRK